MAAVLLACDDACDACDADDPGRGGSACACGWLLGSALVFVVLMPAVARLGGGGGGGPSSEIALCCPTLAGSLDGSNGGGNLRPDDAFDAADWLRRTLLAP